MTERELARRANWRLAIIRHAQEVSGNVAQRRVVPAPTAWLVSKGADRKAGETQTDAAGSTLDAFGSRTPTWKTSIAPNIITAMIMKERL